MNIFRHSQMNDIEITIKKTYRENSHSLLRRYIVIADKKEHMCQEWYPDGVLNYQYSFKNNKKHGRYYGWWENGIPGFIKDYRRGKLHGYENSFFKIGLSASRTFYIKDVFQYSRHFS
jgi:antitoxin component YwqK of YwqJK toxin-antitoxin module